jgi:hypothetical protein
LKLIPSRLQFAGEDLLVHVPLGGVDPDLVPDAAEEGVVDQVLRVEVGAEDDELLERHLELLPAGHRQEVVPVFERQIHRFSSSFGLTQLAAEVVDQEHPAVRLEVDRGLVEVGLGVVPEVEHFEVQFAAGDDHRPADADPPLVLGPGAQSRRTVASASSPNSVGGVVDDVQGRVEHGHDVAVGDEGVGDVDRPPGRVHEVADRPGPWPSCRCPAGRR